MESGGYGYGRYGMANGGYSASRFDEAASLSITRRDLARLAARERELAPRMAR